MLGVTNRLVGVLSVLIVLQTSVYSYSIPPLKWEILQPKGFRVSIPHEDGIALFAFHGSIDHRLNGVSPGDFTGEILSPTSGRWVYENTKIFLDPGTTVYYWVHVQYQSQGYRKIDESYTVPGGTSGAVTTASRGGETDTDRPTSAPSCERSKTTVLGQHVCQGELIFYDNFDTLNSSIWKREVRIPLDVDDADFVSYQDRPENSYIRNGQLFITPTRIDDIPSFDEYRVRSGELNLEPKCTGIVDIERECKRHARLFRILPPVVSARLNTKDSFSFQYGRIEVRAKLPKGDWLFPLIALDPQRYNYGISGYASGQMRIAFIRGNEMLTTKTGQPIDGSYLAGGVVLKPGEEERDTWLKKVHGSEHWGNEFHNYSLTWSENSIKLGFDGDTYATISGGFRRRGYSQSVMAPFDKEFHITLGVSAGGISDFPDESVSQSHTKPWSNYDPKAELMFWNGRDKWHSTWTSSSLIVDHVKVWAL